MPTVTILYEHSILTAQNTCDDGDMPTVTIL